MHVGQRSAMCLSRVPLPAQVEHRVASAMSSNLGGLTGFLQPRALHLIFPVFLHFGQSTLLNRPLPLQPRQLRTPLIVWSFPEPPHALHCRLHFFVPRQMLQRTLLVPLHALQGLRSRRESAIAFAWAFSVRDHDPVESFFHVL